jgi:carboxyl-terminal processing protease
MQSGIVSYFVFEQLDQNRKEFEGLSFESFKKKFEGNNLYVDKFEKYLNANGVSLNLDSHKPTVKIYLMGEFARQLFDEEKYFAIRLKNDLMIQEVLKK